MKLTIESTLKPPKQRNMIKHGNVFSKTVLFLSPGIVHFAQVIRTLEREDPEVAHLHAQVRAHFLPPVSISTEPSS